MTVSRSQTVEDGPPRDRVDRLLRNEGHATENVTIGIEVRDRHNHGVMRRRLVIRAYQADGEVTAAIGAWDEDDGA